MDQEKIKNLQQLGSKDEFEETDQDDVISLCNLPIDHYEESEYESFHDQNSNEDDSFEFCFNNPLNNHQDVAAIANKNNNNIDDINFCDEMLSYNATKRKEVVDDQRCLKKCATTPVTGSYAYRHRYCASNSSSFKQYPLIGVAKISSEMKLSDIKKRQSKGARSRTPMLPVTSCGELAVAGDDECGESGKRSRRGLLGSRRGGTLFISALAKAAYSCFRLVRVCDNGRF